MALPSSVVSTRSTSGSYIGSYFTVYWTETVNDAEANTSTVDAYVVFDVASTSSTAPSATAIVSMTGGSYTFTGKNWTYSSIDQYWTGTSATHTWTISHALDGSGTVDMGAAAVSGACATCEISNSSYTLTSIERRTTLSGIPNAPILGNSYSFTATHKFTTNRITVLRFSGKANIDATKTGTTWTGTYPAATNSNFYSTTSMTYTGYVYVYTYQGSSASSSTLVGYVRKQVTWTLPAYTPTLTVTTAKASGQTLVEGYVKTLNTLAITGSGASMYGGSISSYMTTYDGDSKSGATTTFDLNNAGSKSYSTVVTDSRGRTNTVSGSITVLDYTPPTIALTAGRTTSTATTYTANGTSTKSTEAYASNAVALILSADSTQLATGTDTLTYNGSDLPISQSLTLTLTGSDSFGTAATAVSYTIPAALLPISIGGGTNGTGVAFGGISTADEFQCYLPADFKNGMYSSGTDITNMFLPKFTSAVGNVTQPIYFNASGQPVACTAYEDATFMQSDLAEHISYQNITDDGSAVFDRDHGPVVARGIDTTAQTGWTSCKQMWTRYADGYKEIIARLNYSGSKNFTETWGTLYFVKMSAFTFTTNVGAFTNIPRVEWNAQAISGSRSMFVWQEGGTSRPTTTSSGVPTLGKPSSQTATNIYVYAFVRGY